MTLIDSVTKAAIGAKYVTTSYFTLRSLSIKVFSLLTGKGNKQC